MKHQIQVRAQHGIYAGVWLPSAMYHQTEHSLREALNIARDSQAAMSHRCQYSVLRDDGARFYPRFDQRAK